MLKLAIVASTLLFLVGGFVVNLLLRDAPFNYNLLIVPNLQADSFLSSPAFIVLMNIVSNLFNPIACAGYILAFYVISHRKMELLVFLIWFIFISVGLSFMKALIHQARPYWMQGSGVKMKEWTCYTEYGCPSGHSMLGLVLLQFIIRFTNRSTKLSKGAEAIFYTCGLLLQSLVVFSRMILGMHSLNQVLFGVMLGFASLVVYYSYAEVFILKTCVLASRRSHRMKTVILTTVSLIVSVALMLLTLYGPTYENEQYMPVINSFKRCRDNFKEEGSFQYKCFQDTSLLMAGFGIFYALAIMKNQQNLMKKTTFPRLSVNFFKRLIITVLIALVPVIIFLNPFWKKIDLETRSKAILLWALQSLGLLTSITLMVWLAPLIGSKFNLQTYHLRGHVEKEEYSLVQKRKSSSKSSQKLRLDPNDSLEVPE